MTTEMEKDYKNRKNITEDADMESKAFLLLYYRDFLR